MILVIISGATASGKSKFALQIAKKLNNQAVIINGDALQIYRGLPILSAQPTLTEQQNNHQLYNLIEPWENSSVANWLELAVKEIKYCLENKQIPIVVGGSGMYLQALIYGLSETPIISPEVKNRAEEDFVKYGKEELIKIMLKIGESSTNQQKLAVLDRQRLIRRYQILLASGKNIDYWQNIKKNAPFDKSQIRHYYLDIAREQIYQRCNSRLIAMLKNGAIEEVRNLIINTQKNGYDLLNLPTNICKTIGYEEIINYLGLKSDYQIDKEQLIAIVSQKTRNYAKRQLTWFRNQKLYQKPINLAENCNNYCQDITDKIIEDILQ